MESNMRSACLFIVLLAAPALGVGTSHWTQTTEAEFKAGHALASLKKAQRADTAADVANMVRCGSPYDRPAPAPARFKAGDKVRAKNMHPPTNTRLKSYARGHTGAIVRVFG